MADTNKDTNAEATASTAAPAPAASTPEPKRNLTRESIEDTLRARLVNEGKDAKEAAKLAKKRALEMIPD